MTGFWFWIGVALAGSGFYLEAPPMDTRAVAVELQTQARELGLDARVLRRYRHGTGWQFIVVVEGFDDRAGAERSARDLAERSGQGIAVYRLEGEEAVPVWDEWSSETVAQGELPDAETLMQKAGRSVGGPLGGQTRLAEVKTLRFRYTRAITTTEGRWTAHHNWVASGDASRVATEVVEGEGGTSSVVVMGPEELREADSTQAEAVLQDLSPMARLAWPLQFAAGIDEMGPYRVARQEIVAGRSCWVLVSTAIRGNQPSRIWVDSEHGRPARVDFATEAGRVELTLWDWREPDTGVVVPFSLEVRRDGRLVEQIEVHELSLEPELGESLFGRPAEG